MTGTEALTIVLAQPNLPGGETGGQGPGFGKSTPLGLFLLIALLVAVAFLIRSMSKHVRKVSTSFDQERALSAAPKRVRRAEEARRQREAAEEVSEDETSEDEASVEESGSQDGARAGAEGGSSESGSSRAEEGTGRESAR